MRNLFYLIVFIATLYATCAHAQETKLAEVLNVWNNTKHITPTHGMVYDVALEDDTARYYHNPNGKKFRTRLTFYDAAIGVPPIGKPSTHFTIIEETVDVTKNTGTFEGAWFADVTTAKGWLGSTIAFSQVAGATWTYKFSGIGIEVYAERLIGHGKGMMSVDNGPEFPVLFNTSPLGLPVLIYSKVLGSGDHTLKLRVESGYCLIDYVKIYNVQ